MEKRLEEYEKREKGRKKEDRGEEEIEGRMKEGRLGGEWEELEGMMRELELEREMKSREEKKRNIITRVEKEMKEREKAGWCDEECRELKIKVREELRRWKKQGGKERRIRYNIRCVNKFSSFHHQMAV